MTITAFPSIRLTRAPWKRRGITLVEILVAVCVLGLSSAASIRALLMMNDRAVLSRLKTGATTAAQNEIDQFLSVQPFNPQNGQIPTVCALSDPDNPSKRLVPVYTNPRTNIAEVTGTLLTEVTDAGAFNGRRANVTVIFQYRGKEYRVVLTTLRVSDT